MYGLFSELPKEKVVAFGAKAQFKHGNFEIFYDRIDVVGADLYPSIFKVFSQHLNSNMKLIELAAKKWSTGPFRPKSTEVKILFQDEKIVCKGSMQGTKDWLYIIAYPK